MGVGILAPIPTGILEVALGPYAKAGQIAFRTSEWAVFDKASVKYGGGLPVLICATQDHGDPPKLCHPGYATFRGFYVGINVALAEKHPKPAVPPSATVRGPLPDMTWALFWEVSDLVQLGEADWVPISKLTAEGQQEPFAINFVPQRPMLVTAAFL